MIVTALQILFSLIRYVTETIRSVSLFFSDSEDEPADPNIIYEEPDDEASSSDKDVSDATLPARTTFSIVIFLAGSVRRNKREMLSISQKRIPSPMLPRSAYRGIEREDRGPEHRASWVVLSLSGLTQIGGYGVSKEEEKVMELTKLGRARGSRLHITGVYLSDLSRSGLRLGERDSEREIQLIPALINEHPCYNCLTIYMYYTSYTSIYHYI